MKTKSNVILFLILFFLCIQKVQTQNIWQNKKGVMLVQANLAPGFMKNQPKINAYIGSDLDIFLDDKFSFSCSAWYSFSTLKPNQNGVNVNHSIFWGGAYHFAKPNQFDPYIMIQPGLGFSKVKYGDEANKEYTSTTLVPLISASVGFNFYVGSNFHFLFRTQGVCGHVTADLPKPVSLNELRFSVGLGYNIRAWHKLSEF